jgi:hypothetical protein
MRRMSSLPTLAYCGKADTLGKDTETTQSFRSTCFHYRCEKNEAHPEEHRLSEQDRIEIGRWKKPTKMKVGENGIVFELKYEDSDKERILGLDNDFNFVELPNGISQEELEKIPNLLLSGHLDMAWDVPQLDLVVVNDIKSSIFAVKDKAESLQLHAYGFAYGKLKKRSRYLTAIWDASDGKHYINDRFIECESFEAQEIQERIRLAANNSSDKFTKGSHCSGCWKRDSCPAHLVDLGGENRFAKLFSGEATESDVRQALVDAKGLAQLAEKAIDECKGWAERHGGIRSEDGLKVYKPMLRNGRKTLDQAKVMKELNLESLDKYMKQGESYKQWDWILVKE